MALRLASKSGARNSRPRSARLPGRFWRRSGRAPAGEGAQAILAWFEQSVPRLSRRPVAWRAVGMGVGFGGPVETATGTVLVSHQVSGWDGCRSGRGSRRFGLPTVVANDSNAAGWAEYCLGAGRGTRHFCYMNIGSGIGGALVMDGKLHDGQGFGAAEIGHCYVPDWTVREPGAADELERLCSGWSIERRFRAAASTAPNPVLARLCGGDRERITCAMVAEPRGRPGMPRSPRPRRADGGPGLANVITLVHPERWRLAGRGPDGRGLAGAIAPMSTRECLNNSADATTSCRARWASPSWSRARCCCAPPGLTGRFDFTGILGDDPGRRRRANGTCGSITITHHKGEQRP